MLNLEESRYAFSKILEVLNSPWQPGINYDNLKAAADRHSKRIEELEAAQLSSLIPIAKPNTAHSRLVHTNSFRNVIH